MTSAPSPPFDAAAKEIARRVAVAAGKPKTTEVGLKAIHAALHRACFSSERLAWEHFGVSRQRFYEWKPKATPPPPPSPSIDEAAHNAASTAAAAAAAAAARERKSELQRQRRHGEEAVLQALLSSLITQLEHGAAREQRAHERAQRASEHPWHCPAGCAGAADLIVVMVSRSGISTTTSMLRFVYLGLLETLAELRRACFGLSGVAGGGELRCPLSSSHDIGIAHDSIDILGYPGIYYHGISRDISGYPYFVKVAPFPGPNPHPMEIAQKEMQVVLRLPTTPTVQGGWTTCARVRRLLMPIACLSSAMTSASHGTGHGVAVARRPRGRSGRRLSGVGRFFRFRPLLGGFPLQVAQTRTKTKITN